MTQKLHKQIPDCQEQHVTHPAARRPGRMTQEQRNKGLSVPTISTIHKCPLDCCSLGGLRCLVSCPSLTLPLSAFPNRLAQKLRASPPPIHPRLHSSWTSRRETCVPRSNFLSHGHHHRLLLNPFGISLQIHFTLSSARSDSPTIATKS